MKPQVAGLVVFEHRRDYREAVTWIWIDRGNAKARLGKHGSESAFSGADFHHRRTVRHVSKNR